MKDKRMQKIDDADLDIVNGGMCITPTTAVFRAGQDEGESKNMLMNSAVKPKIQLLGGINNERDQGYTEVSGGNDDRFGRNINSNRPTEWA